MCLNADEGQHGVLACLCVSADVTARNWSCCHTGEAAGEPEACTGPECWRGHPVHTAPCPGGHFSVH